MPIGDFVYFNAAGSGSSASGRITDGTSEGTVDFGYGRSTDFVELAGETYFFGNGDLRRLNADGATSTRIKNLSGADRLTVIGDLMFFRAFESGLGWELWVSDGTFDGTRLVKDIAPGSGNSHPSGFVDVGGVAFFSAFDGTHGRELWKSDGTEAGTVLVKDIRPGGNNSLSSGNDDLVTNGTEVFFAANDGTHGGELWVSDGTEIGTFLTKDINPGSAWGLPNRELIFHDGFVYFQGDHPETGRELWRSNGSPTATAMAKDIQIGAGDSRPDNFRRFGDQFVFSAETSFLGREVYISDGTNTRVLFDVNPGAGSSNPANLTVSNGTILWAADDGSHGVEPWMSDGSETGTRMIADVQPGSASSNPGSFAFSNQTLFFAADDPEVGREPWVVQYVDYGDAPAPYPTLRDDDGARHALSTQLRFGESDVEFEAVPSLLADGDTNETGVTFETSVTPGSQATVNFEVADGATGLVDAWVDFNQDGDWDDAGEQIFDSVSVTDGQSRNFVVPNQADFGDTFARFRISSDGGLSPTGFAPDGEVEDHLVRINANPTAIRDYYNSWADQVVSESVMDNDSDPDGDPLTATLLTEPINGTVQFETNGDFIYTPDPGFVGVDSFFYVAADGNGGENNSRVSIKVQPLVYAENDEFAVATGTTSDLGLVKNDTGAGPLEVRSFENPPDGTVSFHPTDRSLVVFTGSPEFEGITGFEYTTGLKQVSDSPATLKNDEAGNDVSVYGQWAVVGASRVDGPGNSGRVYVYRRSANAWNLHQTLEASDKAAGDQFGFDTDIYGETIVIGAPRDDDKGSNSGAAYVFRYDAETGLFEESRKLRDPNGAANDQFGYSVAIDRATIVVGAPFDDGLGSNSGSIFIYNQNRGGLGRWGYRKRIKASDAATGDQLGKSVDVDYRHVIAGATHNADNGTKSGAAYVFRRHLGGSNRYGEVTKLLPDIGSTAGTNNLFGSAVAIDGRTAVVSAVGYESSSGAAWVFDKLEGGRNNWGQVAILDDVSTGGDNFGSRLGLDGTTIVIGAKTDDPGFGNAGSAFVYELDDSSFEWERRERIVADDRAVGAQFGTSVAIWDSTVVIGAPRARLGSQTRVGRVYFEDLKTDVAVATVTLGTPLLSREHRTREESFAVVQQTELDRLATAAMAAWQGQGVSIPRPEISFADLDGNLLGLWTHGRVLVDTDAAGHGWYVDQTPHDRNDDLVGRRMDLLTVLSHELGHSIGLTDSYDESDAEDLMFGYLAPGQQKVATELDHLFASDPFINL